MASNYIGKLLLNIPTVKQRYDNEVNQEYVKFKNKNITRWEKFGASITVMPDQPWTERQIIDLIDNYANITSLNVEHKHISGTIYSKNLLIDHKNDDPYASYNWQDYNETFDDDDKYFQYIANKQHRLYVYAYSKSYLWNSLHDDEFGIGPYIDFQVVNMVANMFSEKANHNAMGFVTSGGTESLMLAIRCYRNWGISAKAHNVGQGVILACESVHAAVIKASEAYCVKIELVESTEDGKMDIKKLYHRAQYHGNNLIAIIASAPSYPLGVVDPIKKIAKIAKSVKCGMHVDCCLGGFVVNYLSNQETNYYDINGVTSISADTHKNGFAPKGSSVLITRTIPSYQHNLAYYSIYSIPGWLGGVYGSPKDAGSQSCVNSLMSLISILSMGKSGYIRSAHLIYQTALEIAGIISGFSDKLSLVTQPEVNVVAIRINTDSGLDASAIYALAYVMAEHGIVMNTLRNNIIHFCITIRFASDPNKIDIFHKALYDALQKVIILDQEYRENNVKFPGDASLYCTLDTVLNPSREKLSKIEYLGNKFLGTDAAKDGIRSYFLSKINPYV